ncbi:glycosyltransferase WbuB [Spirochaetia bacterium]|nr:glycosyltransferase WbuB [Spirochaetia bacterium]
MKIVYFYQNFSTPKGAWGTRVYEFAKNWVREGHSVTVVTSTFAKSDITTKKFFETQFYDGICVKIISMKLDNKQGSLKRILTWFVYMLVSCWYALILPADVVVASSGPITVGVPGLVARYLGKKKFVFEVRDIWPQGAIELGVLKNKLLIKMAYWLEKCCYMAASYIIALSPGMVDDILRRYPDRKVVSVTNSANIPLFSTPSDFDIGKYKDKKYAIYTGNIGKVNNSEWLCKTARILKNKGRDDILILLIGDGQSRKLLQEDAEQNDITNLIFLDLMPKTQLVAYLQPAMISLVPLKGCPILASSSPNKFFESLAAGVPVIQNTNGWMKSFLADNDVGFTIAPDDSTALADLLIKIADGVIDIKTMGLQAQKIAKEQFDKDYLAKKMLSVLAAVSKEKTAVL